jgi:anti-sigma B factor antagonist
MGIDSIDDQSFPVSSRDGVPVVTAPAEIDFSNAPAFGSALASAGANCATIVVDMRHNLICDSSGLSMLIQAHKHARAAGGEVRMVMHPAHAPKVFKTTGVDRLVKIFSSLDAALGSAQY